MILQDFLKVPSSMDVIRHYRGGLFVEKNMTIKKNKKLENVKPFEISYEVEYLGDGDHCFLGETYIHTHHNIGYSSKRPITLKEAKKFAKENNGKVVKVSRTYL